MTKSFILIGKTLRSVRFSRLKPNLSRGGIIVLIVLIGIVVAIIGIKKRKES